MFEFKQLRCFVALAESLHFGRAAEQLNLTQPPLSRQIQALEHAVGVPLLERNTRTVRLTPAGRAFLPEAQRLLRIAEGAALSAKRVARGEAGVVKLGFTAGSSYAFLPRLVALASAETPDVDLLLREMTTAQQMEALVSGRLDAGLVRLPVDRRGFELVCVARDTMLLAVPDGHKLAINQAVGLRDLDRQALIMYSPTEGRYFYDLAASLFRSAEIAPDYVQHVSQVHTVLALVSAGTGVALVPESARSLLVRGVTLLELRPAPKLQAELYLVWRRGQDNPAFRSLRGLILNKLVGS
jgi:DNA-binding transcriptional LysR family regulator